MPKPPQAMLFDLGNVMLRLKTDDFLARVLARHPAIDPQELLKDLRRSDSEHDAYERGLITGEAFYAALAGRWKLEWTYAEWLKNWNDYFVLNRPMEVLVAKLRQAKVRLFALSNTNAEHIAHARRLYRFFDAFEAVFTSHELGLRKPQPEFFLAAVAKIGLPPEAIVFVDDVALFVETAQSLGLRGFHYTFNDAELKAYLIGQGLDLPVWDALPGHLGC